MPGTMRRSHPESCFDETFMIKTTILRAGRVAALTRALASRTR